MEEAAMYAQLLGFPTELGLPRFVSEEGPTALRRLGLTQALEDVLEVTDLGDLPVERPEPERVAAEMVALVRPGGVVVSHESDYLGHRCDPPSPAWDRLFEIFQAYSRAKGVDLFVGKRTHRMLRDAGIVDVQVNPVIHRQGRLRQRRRADRAPGELRRHLDNPGTLVVSHLFFQVWGHKPGRWGWDPKHKHFTR